jgi:hypothetical protein
MILLLNGMVYHRNPTSTTRRTTIIVNYISHELGQLLSPFGYNRLVII